MVDEVFGVCILVRAGQPLYASVGVRCCGACVNIALFASVVVRNRPHWCVCWLV
jgi:hypothetical protein